MTRLVPLLLILVACAVTPAAADAQPTMLLIHGGSWSLTGPVVTATMAPTAKRFEKLGYRTVAVDYRAGRDGLSDVIAAYDAAAASGEPVCAYRESSGGHWALMLAIRRPALECVIAVAAPTDLMDAAAPILRSLAGQVLGRLLWFQSPYYFAGAIRARVLLADSADDTLVPMATQVNRFAARLRGEKTVVTLAPGKVKWMHGTTSRAERQRLRATQAVFVAPNV